MVTLRNHVILKERPFQHVMASYKSSIYDSSYVFLYLFTYLLKGLAGQIRLGFYFYFLLLIF
jgi:hypothetical protein